MPQTAAEARRATELEEAASKRTLTPEEMAEYKQLALHSHERAIRERMARGQ
jgi:hypothetical protein